jgi:nitroreductase
MDPARETLLHPLLSSRWSPARFDELAEVNSDEVDSILDAARWSPSAGNSQPWAFIVGQRGDATHARLVPHLARSSAPWASTASLLVANLTHRYVQDTDWEYSEFSLYDLGQAVAHMTVQAQSLGLATRQFRAFDRDGLTREFAVPQHWEVTTMSAFGRPASDSRRDQDAELGRERAPRIRRPSDRLLWPHAAADMPR